ncbi:hypothetical protein HOL24_07900 [bacterium]|jgi:hypothetical protein|nr:hypothetical protein [bacterium]
MINYELRKGFDKNTWMFIVYIVAIFAISMAALIPWYPDFIQTASGDAAYNYVYHEIFAGDASCGNDIYCHHGPLGIWYWTIYHPDTFWTLIISHIYVAIVIVATITSIVFNKIRSYIYRVFYILVIIGLLSIDLDARIFLVNILFLTLLPKYFKKRELFLTLLLVSVIAFSFYVKSTFIIFGFVSVIGASFIEMIVNRRFPRIFLWYILFLIIFSFISGMSLLSIPQHIVRTFDFAVGYADMFSEYGNYYQTILFLILSLIFGVLIIKSKKNDHYIEKWIYITCYTALIFLIYKASFTRLDGQHALHGYISIITSMTLYTTANFNVDRVIKYKKIFYTSAPFLVAGLMFFLYENPSIYQGKFNKLHTNVTTAVSIVFGGNPLTILHDNAKKKIVSRYPIESIDGRVMLLHHHQTIGIANNLNLQFIPTITRSIEINSKAEALNSSLFSTSNAPEYLLIPDNSSYPGKTILEIIRNYTFDTYNNAFLQLKKAPNNQVNIIFNENDKFNINIGESVDVSNINDLLWVNIEVNKTVFGKFIEFFYKIPRLYVEIEKSDGTKKVMHISSDLLKSGFILSYVGESLYDIFDKNRYDTNNAVKNFTLKSTGSFTPFFDKIVSVNIKTINILRASNRLKANNANKHEE